MKKLISLLMALLMVFSLTTVAFADEITDPIDETVPTNGTITINGASEGNVYTIYKLLDLESYDEEAGVYSYKVNSAWADFFKAGTGALSYFTVDENDYVTWTAAEDGDTVAAFAKLALAYAEDNDIAAVASMEGTGGDFIKFENLELGYYLVDSTMGALCGLTTTNPDASINAKNGQPTVDKQVKVDSTENWGDKNTADVGQIVEFRTTISVHAGAQNYVLHDKMSTGLTFQQVSKIEHVIPGVETHTLDLGVDYTVETENLDDGCTFHVVFSQEFCDHLETNDKVIVYYEAMLNRNAIVAGEGNPNEAWLDFGEDHHTTHDTTQTFTFGFDIIKTDSQNKLIDGAAFKIYDAAEGGNEIGVVLMEDNVTYRRARPEEQEAGLTVPIVVKDGKVRVVGFDNGTYYLEEVVTPAGYNKLAARQKFIISDANLDSVFNGDIYSTGSGVHVVNKSGTMLPETGAMGTALFIGCGMMLVLFTGVLLVTKKRMSMIQD